ncbi:MAG: cellulose binding domain-containing protein [Myxococcota bacterium]
MSQQRLLLQSAKLCARFVMFPLACVACSATSSPEGDSVGNSQSALACADDTMADPQGKACASVRDRRSEFSKAGTKHSLPSLKDKRAQRDARAKAAARTSSASADDTMPVPGGLGAGVIFKNGALQSANSATLYTKMIIYPDGIGNLPDFLYTTSTNRTEKGVEVVGSYFSADTHHIGVFDWSCTTDAPCEGGQTSPSWIWARPFRDEPCHFAPQADGSGVMRDTLYYANITNRSGTTWSNHVAFWNFCSSSWDVVYSHSYGGTQRDCSLDNGCGWWGPIIENFFPLEGTTPIPPLGFSETRLVHDGVTSQLPDTETDWSAPPSNWNVCYRIPNTSWSATNQACPGSITPSLRITSNWQSGYCAEVTVTNSGSSAVNSWAVGLQMNQSTLNNTWSATFTPTTPGNYRVTPLTWNSTIPAGGNVIFGFCGNKTGTNWTPTVSSG